MIPPKQPTKLPIQHSHTVITFMVTFLLTLAILILVKIQDTQDQLHDIDRQLNKIYEVDYLKLAK